CWNPFSYANMLNYEVTFSHDNYPYLGVTFSQV
ncbi:Hypothetical protein LUCI_0038, partial [Lucifera butyrica]